MPNFPDKLDVLYAPSLALSCLRIASIAYIAMATLLNFAKTSFTSISTQQSNDSSMDNEEKLSLSQPGSPSRKSVLRSGAKHTRTYKSPFTTPICTASDLSVGTMTDSSSTQHLRMIESFPFSLTESSSHASASHASALPTSPSVQVVNPNGESPIGI